MRTTLTLLITIAAMTSMLMAESYPLDTSRPSSSTLWKNSPVTDPNYFPIGVWGQAPRNAGKYKAIGINLYMSLHRGPTEEQLAGLKRHGMKVICHQNAVGLAHLNDPTIIAWMHGDEPDNYTRNAAGKAVHKHEAAKIIADYQRIKRADPTRPVVLNLGQGVANDQWKGGWAKPADYRQFVKGCDIVSYDIYPACSTRENVTGNLWMVPMGVDRLRDYSGGKKIVWNIVECTAIRGGAKATPHEVRSEVWMSLIHGTKGIVYFCHEFYPAPPGGKRRVVSNALLKDATMSAAVGKINRQITELAPVLNSPTIKDGAAVATSNEAVPVDSMVKRHGGAVYVFAAAMRPGKTTATIRVAGISETATVEVIGENRTLQATGWTFNDTFGRWDVHLYKITALKPIAD